MFEATTTLAMSQRVMSTMNLSAVIMSLKLSHISTGIDTQMDLETLYVVIIILAIVGLLSVFRWAKDCWGGLLLQR
jgi:hypothetical protein